MIKYFGGLMANNIEIWNPLIDENVKDWVVCNSENKDKVSKYIAQLLQSELLTTLAGCGCSYQTDKNDKMIGGPGMSDLWALSNDTNRDEIIRITNYQGEENIESLLSHCDAALSFITDSDNNTKISEFTSDMKNRIKIRCSEFLDEGSSFDLSHHVNFLRRVARRPQKNRFMLFTTNYDLCFEKAAGQAQFVIIDGFSFTAPRQFSPSYFSYDLIKRNETAQDKNVSVEALFHLYKLHGSVNWDETDDRIVQNDNPKNPCLIYPANSKYQSSYRQPFLEMMSHYLQILRQPSLTLLVIGSGFADDHLFGPIKAALRSNNEFRLVIVDPCIKDKIERGDGNYHELKQWKTMIDPRLTFINAPFDQFVGLIPEIYKPNAEERLVEIVRMISNS